MEEALKARRRGLQSVKTVFKVHCQPRVRGVILGTLSWHPTLTAPTRWRVLLSDWFFWRIGGRSACSMRFSVDCCLYSRPRCTSWFTFQKLFFRVIGLLSGLVYVEINADSGVHVLLCMPR